MHNIQRFINAVLKDKEKFVGHKSDTMRAYEDGYLKGLKHMATLLDVKEEFKWEIDKQVH